MIMTFMTYVYGLQASSNYADKIFTLRDEVMAQIRKICSLWTLLYLAF